MNRVFLTLVLGVAGLSPVLGNENSMILKSSFEDAEGCLVFNGLNAEVPLVTIDVSGDFTLNGGAFPAVDFDDGRFFLRDRHTGSLTFIGKSREMSFDVKILPGSYDLIYSVESRGPISPHNVDAVLQKNIPLFDDQVFDIDVTRYIIGGDLTLDGGPFPAIDFDDGTFHLRDQDGGEVFLGDSRFGNYSDIPVLPGVYDVLYRLESPGNLAPRNTEAVIGQMIVDATSDNKDIDVPVFNLIGEFTLNGGAFPANDFNDGNFYLESDNGDRVFLGNSHDQSYSRRVIPGVYDVYWELESPGSEVPFNSRARIMTQVAVGESKLSIDVETHTISGDLSLNGFDFPVSDLEVGRMLLLERAANAYSELARTKDQAYEKKVIVGTYDILYQHLNGDDLPQNKGHVIIGDVVIDQGMVLDLNVPSGSYNAGIYQNGALFPADATQAGNVILRKSGTDDLVLLGSTSQQTFSARMVPGTYEAYYWWQKGDQVPGNVNKLIAVGVEVSPPLLLKAQTNNSDLHVTTYSYPGTFRVDGGPTPMVAFDDGEVFLSLLEDSVFLGNTNDQTFSVRVIYDEASSEFQARYKSESIGTFMPINEDSRIGCVKLVPPIL